MNEIQIFNNPEFGEIRTLTIDGEPWFVGKDVAEALGYEAPKNAIPSHVDEDDRVLVNAETQHRFSAEFSYKELGQRGGWLINESGLYSLILSSKLPGAKKFKRWVTSEVLPSIRKTGSFFGGSKELRASSFWMSALFSIFLGAAVQHSFVDSSFDISIDRLPGSIGSSLNSLIFFFWNIQRDALNVVGLIFLGCFVC